MNSVVAEYLRRLKEKELVYKGDDKESGLIYLKDAMELFENFEVALLKEFEMDKIKPQY